MIEQILVKKHLIKRSFISYILYPLGVLNSLIHKLRRRVIRPTYKAPVKIISIGNLVMGGSGKTPLTAFLAKQLQSRGYNVAIAHRGYKGLCENTPTIIDSTVSANNLARLYGDEAAMLALSMVNIPIAVGRNRSKVIQLLCNTHSDLQIVILDDSFQHITVFHDVDILVFNSRIGLGNGFVFPAGYLRESIHAIKKQDFIIINTSNEIKTDHTLIKKINAITSQIYYIKTRIKDFIDNNGAGVSVETLQNSKVALISAIGSPFSFESSLLELNVSFSKHFSFPDHYSYQDPIEVNNIVQYLQLNKIDYLITTQKDLVKLKQYNELSCYLITAQLAVNSIDKPDELINDILYSLAI